MTKVMLVEDDANMVYLLKTLLTLEGFQVTSMEAVDKVIEQARTEKPDVMLMDVHLVGGNGLDLLREMRTFDELKKTVAIMASGMYVQDEARAAGANAFLLKPFMPDDLIKVIRQNLPPQ
jgi:DNA-binding response OmpR family regulator